MAFTGTSLALGEHQRGHVGEAELELAADHTRHDGRAALREGHRQFQAVLAEEALLLAEVERGDIDDGDDPHLDRGGTGGRTGVVRRSVAGRTAGRRGDQHGSGREADEQTTHGNSCADDGVPTGCAQTRTVVLNWC
jgi:hypothetical protein